MTGDELRSLWSSIARAATRGTLEAKALTAASSWLARDDEGRCHFLLEVREGADVEPVTTRGLSVSVVAHQVPGRPPADFIDFVCIDDAVIETFAAVVADVADAAGSVPLDSRAGAVREVLARWRWFWDVSTDRLSDADALGLFAELWFLRRWLGVSGDGVSAWTASEGARHDFQTPAFSVEVKVTSRRGDSGAVHHIAHLDQLTDPEQGVLYLFSLRVTGDRLSANSLPSLIDDISSLLASSPPARQQFLEKLARRGYVEAARSRHTATWRILGERLFEVRDEFPRLTLADFASGIPPGVLSVSYDLDTAVCEPWLVAEGPASWTRPTRQPEGNRTGDENGES